MGKITNGHVTPAELANLTLGEIKLFSRIYESPERCGITLSQSESGFASALSKKNLLLPFGKIGDRIRWKAVDLSVETRNFLKELVRPGLGEYGQGASV